MEKSNKVAVISAGFDWSDMSFSTLASALNSPDSAGTRLTGERLLIDVRNTFIQGSNLPITR